MIGGGGGLQHYNVAGITNVTGVLFISVLIPNFFAQVFLEDVKMDRAVRIYL